MNFAITGRIFAASTCLAFLGGQNQDAARRTAPFRIVATDAGFEAPAVLAAGLRHVVLENRGTEIHEAMLVKLPKNMSPDDYVAAVKRGSLFPEGALDYSGPGLTSPGFDAEMWLKVDPGQYIIICWNDDHAETRPVHPFTVEELPVPDDQPPKEDLVVKLFDFRFMLDGELHRGTQVIRVETPGPSMHEMDIFRLHDGRTLADLVSWRKQKHPGPAPADALGGALDSHDIKRVVWLRKNFRPGRYVLHCEMPAANTAGGKKMTHADLGMAREIEIK